MYNDDFDYSSLNKTVKSVVLGEAVNLKKMKDEQVLEFLFKLEDKNAKGKLSTADKKAFDAARAELKRRGVKEEAITEAKDDLDSMDAVQLFAVWKKLGGKNFAKFPGTSKLKEFIRRLRKEKSVKEEVELDEGIWSVTFKRVGNEPKITGKPIKVNARSSREAITRAGKKLGFSVIVSLGLETSEIKKLKEEVDLDEVGAAVAGAAVVGAVVGVSAAKAALRSRRRKIERKKDQVIRDRERVKDRADRARERKRNQKEEIVVEAGTADLAKMSDTKLKSFINKLEVELDKVSKGGGRVSPGDAIRFRSAVKLAKKRGIKLSEEVVTEIEATIKSFAIGAAIGAGATAAAIKTKRAFERKKKKVEEDAAEQKKLDDKIADIRKEKTDDKRKDAKKSAEDRAKEDEEEKKAQAEGLKTNIKQASRIVRGKPLRGRPKVREESYRHPEFGPGDILEATRKVVDDVETVDILFAHGIETITIDENFFANPQLDGQKIADDLAANAAKGTTHQKRRSDQERRQPKETVKEEDEELDEGGADVALAINTSAAAAGVIVGAKATRKALKKKKNEEVEEAAHGTHDKKKKIKELEHGDDEENNDNDDDDEEGDVVRDGKKKKKKKKKVVKDAGNGEDEIVVGENNKRSVRESHDNMNLAETVRTMLFNR